MSVQTPDVNSHMTPEAKAVSPSTHVSQGGGGSTPGWCESPAGTDGASASVSARARNSLFIDSPSIVVTELGGFAASVPHDTAQTDPALVLFRALADRKDFDSLTRLCDERHLVAPDEASILRWRKDRAIVEALRGDHVAAYNILRDAHWLASRFKGTPRGKYEAEFGIMHASLGRSSLAIERFNVGYQSYRRDGNLQGCARVDHNRARALITRGETQKAMRYIRRALDYARANNDFRLELEVLESIKEFGGMS